MADKDRLTRKGQRFMKLITDFAFKRVFGEERNKRIMIAMLNDVIKPERKIVDIIYQDKENLHEDENVKKIVFDIWCKTEDGRHIVVEMQNRVHDAFMERSVYYTARSFSRQLEKGRHYSEINEVYGIFILNNVMEGIDKPYTAATLMDRETRRIVNDKFNLIYLSLAELTKNAEECTDPAEMWMYVLKHSEKLEEIPFKEKIEAMEYLENEAEMLNLCNEDIVAYERSLKYTMDYENAIWEAENRGKTEGRAEGKAEGRLIEAKKIAKKLKQIGMALIDIHKATGLDMSVIEAL